MPSGPVHLILCHRKALALRWLILAASDGLEEALEEDADWQRFTALLEVDLRHQLPPKRSDGLRLDRFIRNALAAAKPQGAPSAVLAPALTRLTALSDDLSCDKCAAVAEGLPCHGPPDNDARVAASAGHCLAPLKDAFRAAESLAAAIYLRAGGLTEVSAAFSTQPGRPSPLNFMPIALTGQVLWMDEDAARHSELQLSIDAAALDRNSLNMLPYTVMHELICHVYQFAAGAPRRGEPDAYCAFAEGWMDFVASMIVCGGRHRGAPTPWRSQPACMDMALSTHMQRRQPPFPDAAKVALGARIAERVLTLFEHDQQESRLPRTGWDDFVDLSCQLNANPDWTQKLRQTCLPRLNRRLGLGREDPAVDADLIDTLLKWRRVRVPGTPGEALRGVIDTFAAKPLL